MSKWIWLDPDVLLAAHDEQLQEHGGLAGIRDAGLFESALARARNIAAFGTPDIANLAAAYAYGLAKNHPFADGNKRTAFVALELFLTLNGFELVADDAQCVVAMLAVASGDLPEPELVDWIRKNIQPAGRVRR